MRVQHNIMAMNSYRNYNNNTKALTGNLEKLSSGYKINRAGDDAAGLAISEKMRSQITGLDAAQKNVKDGISLVKTAEGAMQEIQDMLKRMKYLATQSANGTYQNEVDRDALQDEVVQLQSEIDRIADAANFNGIKLLDGSLAGKGKSRASQTTPIDMTTVSGTIGGNNKLSITPGSTDLSDLTKLTSGTSKVTIDGKDYTYDTSAQAGDAAKFKDFADLQTKAAANGVTIGGTAAAPTASKPGAGVAVNIGGSEDIDLSDITAVATVTLGDKTYTYNGTNPDADSGEYDSLAGLAALAAKDGYTLATDDDTAVTATKAGAPTPVTISGDATAPSTLDLSGMDAALTAGDSIIINNKTYTYEAGADGSDGAKFSSLQTLKTAASKNNVTLDISDPTKVTATVSSKNNNNGGGRDLQIGDTADSFNRLGVTIQDMHADALVGDGTVEVDGVEVTPQNIGEIDITTQEGARKAMYSITAATNTVSAVRGTLGALQNRLEHTGNNLATMAENIQDAESTIRDTDVAEEMMSYVKNNILVQSAQAMLAQANQVPQGVLQLLG